MKDQNRVKRALHYTPGVGLSLHFANWMFQRIIGIDRDCPFPKHFTSRVLHGSQVRIVGNPETVMRSFSVSGGCYINAGDGLTIHEGTIWAPNVSILAQDHDPLNLVVNRPTQGVTIGANSWIGFGAVILPNCELGPRTIVAANAVVRSSFKEGHVVLAGVPAKPVSALK